MIDKMENRRWGRKGRFLAGLISTAVFLSSVVLVPKSVAAEIQPIVYRTPRYVGTTIDPVTKDVYRITDQATGKQIPAYCWDWDLPTPPADGSSPGYFETDKETIPLSNPGGKGQIERYPQIMDMSMLRLDPKSGKYYIDDEDVLRVMYNGAGANAAGIKEAYGLTDHEFHRATQWALWRLRGRQRDNEFANDSKIFCVYNLLLTGKKYPNAMGPFDRPRHKEEI